MDDEVSNASISKETGVVDEGGDSFGDITTDGIMVLDLDGESEVRRATESSKIRSRSIRS